MPTENATAALPNGIVHTVSQEKAFEAALDKNPRDWSTRLVYADWLHDEGRLYDELAQRRMAAWRSVPLPLDNRPAWSWCNFAEMHFVDVCETMPFIAWEALNEMLVPNYPTFHATRKDAEKALADALRSLHVEVLGLPPLE